MWKKKKRFFLNEELENENLEDVENIQGIENYVAEDEYEDEYEEEYDDDYDYEYVSKKPLGKLVMLVSFMAIMLITTTYAWFSTNKEVTIGNLEGIVNVVEGLEVSLDAEHWSDTIDFSKYTDQTTLRKMYGNTDDVLQLNANSLVTIKTGGSDTAGLQNTVRVALAKYTPVENGTTASVDVTATQQQILNATTGVATIGDVAIWEPNSSNHETQIVENNNKITWYPLDRAGYIADQTNGKFTETEKVPTYGL